MAGQSPAPPAAYAGPVEGLTLDEAAVRLRITRETFERLYDGPRIKVGRETRVSAKHLDAWMDRLAGLLAQKPPANDKGGPEVSVA